MKHNNFKFAISLSLTFYTILPLTTQASGFRLPEISIAGMGTSNALVADTVTPGAMPYNPAAMAFHKNRNVIVGIMNIHPKTETTPIGGTTTESKGGANVQTPSIYYMDHINQKMTLGVAINAVTIYYLRRRLE